MANMKIDEVEGIGPVYAEKLSAAGITNTDKLLEAGCTKPGRKGLAEETGISEAKLLDWVNMVDLCRVNGIGAEVAELLERAGVDTVRELATRNAENLAAKCAEVNEEKKVTRRVPNSEVVQGWIDQAKDLPPKVEH
jgi:predicted flap endonuclease-1-like 5' DNA nuclease